MLTAPSVPFLDLLSRDFDLASDEVDRAREQYWFAQSPQGPVVLRYDECTELLKDPRLGLDGREFLRMNGVTSGPMYDWWITTVRNTPQEDHLRLRSVAAPGLSPKRVEALRPALRTLAQKLARDMPADEIVDFAERFGSPYASGAIARLLGVPDEDHEMFRLVSKDAGLVFVWSDLPAVLPIIDRGIEQLKKYVHDLFELRLREPGEDLVSFLAAEVSGTNSLSRAEAEGLVLDIAWASQESVARQLGRALIAFHSHPRQWELVHRSPELIGQAVDEVLRFAPQIRAIFRFATERIDYRDLTLDRGQFVMFCPPSATRDPRAYEGAGTFDILAKHQKRQLIFGGGIFRCLGSGLARIELEEALVALMQRFTCPLLPDPATWRAALPMVNIRDALPIRWERRSHD